MLVRQAVADSLDLGSLDEDLLAHLVHGVLHTGRVLLGKSLESDLSCVGVCLVEDGRLLLDLLQSGELLPLPCALDLGAENAVPDLGKTGVLVAVEAIKGGPGRLEHEEFLDSALDADALAFARAGLNGADLGTVAEE